MPQNGLVTREYYKIVLYKKVGANSNPEIEKLKSQKRIKLSQNKISSLIFGSFMPACVDWRGNTVTAHYIHITQSVSNPFVMQYRHLPANMRFIISTQLLEQFEPLLLMFFCKCSSVFADETAQQRQPGQPKPVLTVCRSTSLCWTCWCRKTNVKCCLFVFFNLQWEESCWMGYPPVLCVFMYLCTVVFVIAAPWKVCWFNNHLHYISWSKCDMITSQMWHRTCQYQFLITTWMKSNWL